MRFDLLLSYFFLLYVCFRIFIFLQCLEGRKEQLKSQSNLPFVESDTIDPKQPGTFLFEALCVKS